MDTKHTPGPWRIGAKFQSVVSDGPTGWDDDGSVAAYGGHMVCESAKLEANARLIAAAPDLLDALENLTIAVGMGWDLEGVCEVARAAIAKATGSQQ